MKFFIETIKQSIYSPFFYRSVPELPFSASVKYFIKLMLFQALIITIIIGATKVPAGKLILEQGVIAELEALYPEELVITIKDGIASSNVVEPYLISLPGRWRLPGSIFKFEDFENLAVINTAQSFELKKFQEYGGFIMLNRETLAVAGGDNDFEVISLSDLPDYTLDKEKFIALLRKFELLAKFIVPISIPLIFLASSVFYGLGLAVYLLIIALLVWVLARSQGLAFGYKKSYQASLHLVTLAVFVDLVLLVFSLPAIPYLFTILVLAAALLNFLVKPKQEP